MAGSNRGSLPKLPLPPNLQALIADKTEKTSAVTSTEVKKPQVVTIDDPKTLQALASSAKSKVDREKVTIIDTSAILSGRATSGVTITPSRAPGLKHVEAKTPSPALPVLNSKLTSTLAASG